ncbi:MAG: hypothetical protein IAF01_03310 [Xanthomonadaceae bacterium]|nr:hypothetical protein [Xanthomonadaceae bacterium]MCA0198142.1 hypothetical protein [Pseudomonadota bacterium]
MKRALAMAIGLMLAACASPGRREASMSAAECLSRTQALQADTEAARAAAGPALEAYRNNPGSFEAKAAVELALQRAARVAADHAQAAADLARGPCKGTSAGRP